MFLLRLLKRLLKAALYLVLFVVMVPLLGLAWGFATTGPIMTAASPQQADAAPPEGLRAEIRKAFPAYQRPEESTFLTYPEWAIVYAAREYAGFVNDKRESGFPYWSYIGRFWQDYAMVIRATDSYPVNWQNHQMLAVIGTSHTIENVIQWAWENTVGRITEATSGRPVAADRYIAGVAAEYAAFLDQVPWYQFPYSLKRDGLDALEPAGDDDGTRTAERKLAFSAAWSIKQAYADLIRSALSATSDPAQLDIYVWASGPVAAAIEGEADTTLLRDMGDDGTVFVTRRYQVFTDMIPRLIGKGVRFLEIGGNDDILVTVLSADVIPSPAGAREVFSYPLPARPELRRTGLAIGVRDLHAALPGLFGRGARLEHVYDY